MLGQFQRMPEAELLSRFPRPSNVTPPHWDFENEDEEFAEAYLRNPPDPGPLSQYSNHGWIDDEQAEVLEIMNSSRRFKENSVSKILTFYTIFKKTHYTFWVGATIQKIGVKTSKVLFTEWFNQEKPQA